MSNSGSILITGATGFLGSYLTKNLVKSSSEIIVLKRTQSHLGRIEEVLPKIKAIYDADDDGVTKAFQNNKIDTVIHCATDYGRKHSDSLKVVQANLLLPLSILKEGKNYGLKHFINTDTLLDKRVSDYSLSKKQFKEWLQSDSKNLVLVNVAIEHFYGPTDDKSKFVSWVISQYLSKVPQLKLTAGEQKRDFIYYTDVLNALSTILNWAKTANAGYYHYEIGTGTTTSIKELVLQIANICQNNSTETIFGEIPYRQNEAMDVKVDLLAISKLGWLPQVDLLNGLNLTIEKEKQLISQLN